MRYRTFHLLAKLMLSGRNMQRRDALEVVEVQKDQFGLNSTGQMEMIRGSKKGRR
jgi:hypothetical protein